MTISRQPECLYHCQPFLNLYIVICIDCRVDPAQILGVGMGEAVIARNIGGRVTPAVIRDIAYVSYLVESKAPEALQTSEKIVSGPWRLYGVAMAQYTLKNPAASQRALDELIEKNAAQSAYQIADVYAWRGEPDKAFDWLGRAFRQRDAGLININIDPLVNSLRADPRYVTLLRQLKLPELSPKDHK